ncbi:hypothetical protein BC938DRAFT_472711 [Jimgerdemannia flammicorona]|uniref:Uncharacterized protein n=1 Tax=Jimgerdemannia flammicorona TaxID=994334 RepID=A0A433Q5I3_9FUNG|nr:hypothetical protein BC938DRAFT_472711 [Jimgerdemannia flammicorona]
MTMHSSNPDFIYIVTNKVSTKRENFNEFFIKFSPYQPTHAADNPKVKKNSVLIRFSLRSQTRQSDRDRLLKARQCAGLQMSLDGAFLIMAGKYKLHVWKVDHDTKKFEFKT